MGKTKFQEKLDEEFVGMRFGKLVVIRRIGSRKKSSLWLCRCDCGNEHNITRNNLEVGIKSCGCLHREQAATRRTLRYHNPIEYSAWGNAKARASNPRSPHAHNYVLRGIIMCEGWMCSFPSFLADMGKRPNGLYSVDRIDNSKGYTCGHCGECLKNGWEMNCRWADRIVQANNTRTVKHLITMNGKTQGMRRWALELGIHPNRVRSKMRHNNITAIEALQSCMAS